jgi:hypothetical protein
VAGRETKGSAAVVDERELNVLFPLFVCGWLSNALLQREIRGGGLTPSEFGMISAIAVWGRLTPRERLGTELRRSRRAPDLGLAGRPSPNRWKALSPGPSIAR